MSPLPNALTSKKAKTHEMNLYVFFNKLDLALSRISITLKFKMLWFPNEARNWAVKL